MSSQAMSIKTRSQAAKEDDPLIQCAKCGRWAYILTESEFKTAKEAEGGTFVCRLCQTIEEMAKSHQEEIEKLEQSFNERFKHLEDAVKTSSPAPNDEGHTLKECIADLLHRLQLSECKAGASCGHITRDFYATYKTCHCPANHLCTVPQGRNRKVENVREAMYEGAAYQALCLPSPGIQRRTSKG
ncbi:hypothetical protein ISCGN_010982 [Ixodes scapularis]